MSDQFTVRNARRLVPSPRGSVLDPLPPPFRQHYFCIPSRSSARRRAARIADSDLTAAAEANRRLLRGFMVITRTGNRLRRTTRVRVNTSGMDNQEPLADETETAGSKRRERASNDREVDLDAREESLRVREALGAERDDETDAILHDADARDLHADARDTLAEERDRAASLHRSFTTRTAVTGSGHADPPAWTGRTPRTTGPQRLRTVRSSAERRHQRRRPPSDPSDLVRRASTPERLARCPHLSQISNNSTTQPRAVRALGVRATASLMPLGSGYRLEDVEARGAD